MRLHIREFIRKIIIFQGGPTVNQQASSISRFKVKCKTQYKRQCRWLFMHIDSSKKKFFYSRIFLIKVNVFFFPRPKIQNYIFRRGHVLQTNSKSEIRYHMTSSKYYFYFGLYEDVVVDTITYVGNIVHQIAQLSRLFPSNCIRR